MPSDLDSIDGYLLGLVSPNKIQQVGSWIASDWLHDRLDDHANALNDLRISHPPVYHAVMGQRLRDAARLGCHAQIKRARLTRLLIDHARILLIDLAHSRIGYIRQLATNPYGRHFAGFTKWKSTGHVLLATVAEPALVVTRVATLARTFEGDDEAARAVLRKEGLLMEGAAAAFVWEVALDSRELLRRANFEKQQLASKLEGITVDIAPAARMTNRDMAQEKLMRSSMSAFWFGLEPTEAATYVAIDLLKALDAVESVVEAILDGRRIPRATTVPSKSRTIFAATVLRAEGKPDREAEQLMRARTKDGGLDPGNKGARGPFASLQAKLRDPTVASAASSTFGIDPLAFFRR